jgi:DNA helicase-2/ATP-dependent DNA helicase PcrA
MINSSKQEELEFLESIKETLLQAIRRIDDRVKNYAEELRQKKEYMHEHQSSMDEADKVSADQSVNRMASAGENTVTRKRKMLKLIDSPYFGRIDFINNDNRAAIYIGVHTFFDDCLEAAV